VTQQVDKKVSLTSKITPSGIINHSLLVCVYESFMYNDVQVDKISDGFKNGITQTKLWFNTRIDMKPHENRLRPIQTIIYYSLAFKVNLKLYIYCIKGY